MSALYHPALYAADRHVESFWAASAGPEVEGWAPLAGDARCDVAVIGAGYSGLSTAYHLARDYGLEVRVLEAGPPGWGASGRNGGFCCIGGARLDYDAMETRYGRDETRSFFAAQCEAIDLVAALAAEEGFDIAKQGAGEICVAHKPSRLPDLALERDALAARFGQPSAIWSREELAERAYAGPHAHGALFMPRGFGLHPMKYARGLARAALRRGAVIHGRTKIDRWEREGRDHVLHSAGGRVRAPRVVIAANGFLEDGLHAATAGCFLPTLSNILVTRPLTADELGAHRWSTETPVYCSRELLFYYRLLPGRRFMLGGRGGFSANPAGNQRARAWLEAALGRLWPEWRGIETTHFWRGLVCLSRNFTPHVGPLAEDPSVYLALAYHGNGVALASWSGRALARLIGAGPERAAIPAPMADPPRRFPFPRLRLAYARAFYLGYGIKDRWL